MKESKVRDRYDFKRLLESKRVRAFEVANYLGLTESALSKRLRNPSEAQLEEMVTAVMEIAKKAS